MASVKEKLYSRIMEIKDDLILIELGEYEGTASSAAKLPLTYDRLTEKYIKKYGDPGTFNKGGSVKKPKMNKGGMIDYRSKGLFR
tara:strand:+ start:566 stop:820 length:255 start_codon:yes stop_codon:yes gene_type:complete